MNPFYFGSSQKPLFGVYHASQSRPVKDAGVVICQPLGHEYVRAHRAIRHLALMLAKAGFHVLRFDYYATGDSGGDGHQGGVAQWTQDIRTAIDELKDASGMAKVSVVGVRAGALLAVVATAARHDVDGILLWDPVVTGARYCSAVDELNREWLGGEYPPGRDGVSDVTEVGALGFHFTAAMRSEFAALDLLSLDAFPGRRLWVVVSQEEAEHCALRGRLQELRVSHRYAHMPAHSDWTRRERVTAAILPHQVSELLQGIVAALC